MIGNRLLESIERDSLALGTKWALGMLESEFTLTYKKFTREELIKRGKDDFDNLVRLMAQNTSFKEIGRVYVGVGKARYLEKFPLSELLFAIHFSKKILWEHMISSGVFSDSLGLYQALNMMMKIDNFYDVACIYMIRGYSEALFLKLSHDRRNDDLNIRTLFPDGSFFAGEEIDDQAHSSWLSGWNLFKTK